MARKTKDFNLAKTEEGLYSLSIGKSTSQFADYVVYDLTQKDLLNLKKAIEEVERVK